MTDEQALHIASREHRVEHAGVERPRALVLVPLADDASWPPIPLERMFAAIGEPPRSIERAWVERALLSLGTLGAVGIAIVAALLVYEHSLVKADDLSRVNAAFLCCWFLLLGRDTLIAVSSHKRCQ